MIGPNDIDKLLLIRWLDAIPPTDGLYRPLSDVTAIDPCIATVVSVGWLIGFGDGMVQLAPNRTLDQTAVSAVLTIPIDTILEAADLQPTERARAPIPGGKSDTVTIKEGHSNEQ